MRNGKSSPLHATVRGACPPHACGATPSPAPFASASPWSADHSDCGAGAGRLSDRLGLGHPGAAIIACWSRPATSTRPDGRRRTARDAGTAQPLRPAGVPPPFDRQSRRRDHDRSRAEGRSAAAAGPEEDYSSGSPLSLVSRSGRSAVPRIPATMIAQIVRKARSQFGTSVESPRKRQPMPSPSAMSDHRPRR